MTSIETKVIAAAAGSGLGASVGAFATWVLGVTVWHASSNAEAVPKAIGAVPSPVADLLVICIGIVGAGVAGYRAPHTSRPDLTAPAAPEPAGPVDGVMTMGS